jgi:hypothetical protein
MNMITGSVLKVLIKNPPIFWVYRREKGRIIINHASVPSAGITRIRFKGYNLSPLEGHPHGATLITI